MSDPIRFPELHPEELPWRNELLGTSRAIPITVGSSSATLKFTAEPASTTAKRVLLSAGDLIWSIGVVEWDNLPVVAQSLGADALSGLPDEILLAVLEAIFQPQLDWLGDRISSTCQLNEVVSDIDRENLPHEIGFSLKLERGATMTGSVAGDTGAIALIRDLVLSAAPTPAMDVSHLPLVTGIEIGMTQIPAEELRKLAVGDVLMMEISTFGENGRALVRFQRNKVWKANVEDETILFDEAVDSPAPTSLGDGVTLNVTFELGRITLTAAQVASLAPGASIPRVKSDQVWLTAENRAFASGELVRIGDRLGVRVASISSELPTPTPAPQQIDLPRADTASAEEAPVESPETGEPGSRSAGL